MAAISPNSGLGRWLTALVLGLAAWANASAAVEFGSAERDRIADLKVQALTRLGERRAAEADRLYPQDKRVSIYVGVSVERFRLERVTVHIDGRPPVGRSYTPEEASALHDEGLHRIVRTNIEPGEHSLRIDFVGRVAFQEMEGRPIEGRVEMEFAKGESAKAMIVPLVPQALRPTRELTRPTWSWNTEPEDPRLGQVRYLRRLGANFDAALELLAMRAGSGGAGLSPTFHAMLAHAYLDFGMETPARRELAKAVSGGVDTELARDVRLRLAELVLSRGRDDEALAALRAMEDDLTKPQLVIWQGLMSRILMDDGRHRDAVRVLTRGDTEREVLTEPASASKQTLYMRYNYAVALLQAGETVQGRTLLDRLGRMRPFGVADWGLRDQANLTLAYHFLNAEQGATAKKIFQRIRLDGPFSEHALLGLGWAELAPRGKRQGRVPVGDEPEPGTYGISDTTTGRFNRGDMPERFSADAFRQVELVPFKQAEQAETETERRRRALVAWQELAGRAPAGEAVQQGRIAIAHAFEELGAEDAAMARYRDGVDELEDIHERLRDRIGELRREASAEGLRRLDNPSLAALTRAWQAQYVPDVNPRVRWLQELFVSPSIHEVAEDYLDLYLLALALRGEVAVSGLGETYGRGYYKGVDLAATAGVAPGGGSHDLVAAMDEAVGLLRGRLRSVAAGALTERLARIEEFIASARLGLARLYEKRLAQAQPVGAGR